MQRNARGFAWPRGTKVYHATTALRAVSEEGFKTRDELGGRHATGGGPSTSISFTLDKRVAQSICLGLRALALGTRGEIGLGDLIIQGREIAPKAIEETIKNERLTPEEVVNLDNGLYGFYAGMGMGGRSQIELTRDQAEDLIESGVATQVEEKYSGSGATRAKRPYYVSGWAPIETLQPFTKYHQFHLRPWFYGTYNHFLGMGSMGELYNPVFFMTSLEAMAEQAVDDIGIIEAEVGADWLCSGYQEAQELGYDVTKMYAADMSDWTHACETHLRDIVEKREYPWRGRPPRREWEEPLPEDTVVYLASGMAELRVYNPQLVTGVRIAENMDDVLWRAKEEWDERGKQVDENALAWPYFRSNTPYVVR